MTSPPVRSLDALLATREIVVFCGSGGVGKTSVAAATALGAASRQGGRVLVITVDPAKRLASALGLGEIGNFARRVPEDAFKAAGLEAHGELYALMLDTKQSWDELVMRHAPDEETAMKILENRLYHNLTARFVQSHDYIAVERLYELHAGGDYDLIVVDTPPSRNAIDFLDAPQRMAEFFGGRLLRMLTLPYRMGGRRGARVINVASRPFYTIADRLLGSQLLQDIAEFFLLFQTMYAGFVERSQAVERLLKDRRITFVVVTTLEAAPLREAESFIDELDQRKFHLGALVLNKTLPGYFLDRNAMAAADVLQNEAPAVAADLGGVVEATAEPLTRVLRTVAASFHNFGLIANREAELRTELAEAPDVTVDVPDLEGDVHDLRGLARIADRLFEESPQGS